MRYAATKEPDNRLADLWCVIDNTQDGTDLGTGRWFTRAEAEVIVFALNAVNEGHRLHYDRMSGDSLVHVMYDGPTEGI